MKMECSNCGFKNNSKSLFCGNCGNAFANESQIKREKIQFNLLDDSTYALQAWRNERFWAAFIDALLVLPLVIFYEFVIKTAQNIDEIPMIYFVLFYAYLAALLIIQGVKLTRLGQTIGKQVLKIKIVRIKNGKNGGFWINCVFRTVPVWILALIPFIGHLLNYGDVLYIYKDRYRRCVHDLIAGTCVIKVDQP